MAREKRPSRPKAPVGDVRDPDSLYHHLLRYLAHLSEKNYSPQTVEIRDEQIRYFIRWCEERALTRPRQLDRPILERYQRYLFYYRKKDGEPLSVRSQYVRLVSIRHWLKWLTKQGHLLYNPAADLELPRQEHRLPKVILSAREAEAVLAVPDIGSALGLRDRAILETFYSTGMRRMELAGLHVQDLDFERGTVMIRQGKGKKDRMIPIGERALAWIEAYRDRARPDLVAGRDDGTLFLTKMGEMFRVDRVTDLVKDYVNESAIGKKGACHMFRHTMATLMLENGADIRFIQAMLGHANLETTQIYTQVSIRKLKAIHTATHPGRLGKAGQHVLTLDPGPRMRGPGEDEAEPTAEDVLAALDREAAEEAEA